MKRSVVLTLTLLGLVVAGATLLTSQEAPKENAQKNPQEKLMEVKSHYAHRLLDAIIQEDFKTIRDQAFRLKAVAETADWRILDTPEYVQQSDAFVHVTERLLEAARKENGDAAAIAYMDLTLRCVQCHRYLRNRTPPPN